MRTVVAVLIVLLSLAAPAPNAEGRTWTDLLGNQTTADFVRVHNGMVILLRFPRTLTASTRMLRPLATTPAG